ncbi:hypothetical protein [Desulforhopalus sp. 52FAK]
MQKRLEFIGLSGTVYTFDVYSKSAQLPTAGGVFILTYSHPRGHLAGFQVNVLRTGTTSNLNSAVADLRQDDDLLEKCWNYTCTICLDDPTIRDQYFEDLRNTNSIQC